METVNTQALRESLSITGNTMFDTTDDTIDTLFDRFVAWMKTDMLKDDEKKLGAQIYNEAIQGV
jgi:hypothetical protein